MKPGALVLDFGGVVTRTLFETHALTERRLGLAPGTLTWRGPFDPASDPLWRDMQADKISERDYWVVRTREVGALVGEQWDRMDTFVQRARGDDIAHYSGGALDRWTRVIAARRDGAVFVRQPNGAVAHVGGCRRRHRAGGGRAAARIGAALDQPRRAFSASRDEHAPFLCVLFKRVYIVGVQEFGDCDWLGSCFVGG